MTTKLHSLAACVALALAFAGPAAASIGPVADLTISNADVSPDGYNRSAVVVNGQTPGPLIVGNKVRTKPAAYRLRL